MAPHPDPKSTDQAAASFDASAPSHQWQLHSAWALGARTMFDAALYYVGPLRQLAIPAYTRADTHLEFKLAKPLSITVIGQNLFNHAHQEFGASDIGSAPTLIPRSATLQLVWLF